MLTTYTLLFFGCLTLLVLRSLFNRQRRPTFPPGPPGLPVIGNVLDLPKSHEWLAYQKWGKTYGTQYFVHLSHPGFLTVAAGTDILYLRLLGTPLIVLNTVKASQDLFEKRTNLYSDR